MDIFFFSFCISPSRTSLIIQTQTQKKDIPPKLPNPNFYKHFYQTKKNQHIKKLKLNV